MREKGLLFYKETWDLQNMVRFYIDNEIELADSKARSVR